MKTLHSELAEDASIMKRFRREAMALSKLSHPHIVRTYGLYQSDNLVFLLQDYIDGLSLKSLLNRRAGGTLPLPEMMTVMKALCSALGFAHASGVIHCDIKPANVMVDRAGKVFLTDFGIARHAESTTTTLAQAGAPAYMAPEQILGKPVNSATDIYSLGVLLFECLTGRRPFQGNEASAASGGETTADRLRFAHLRLPPPNPASINPSIHPQMAAVMLKALSKQPGQRYPSAAAFLDAAVSATGMQEEHIPAYLGAQSFPDLSKKRPLAQTEARPAAPARRPGASRAIYWAAGALTLIVIFALLGSGLRREERPDPDAQQGEQSGAEPVPTSVPVDAQLASGDVSQSEALPIEADNLDRLQKTALYDDLPTTINEMAISADARWLAVASGGNVEMRSLDDPGQRFPVYVDAPINSLVFSSDGNWLAGITEEGYVNLLPSAAGQQGLVFMPDQQAQAVGFSTDSRLMYVVDLFGSFTAMETASQAITTRMELSDGLVTAAAFSPDRQLVALGLNGGNVLIRRIDNGALVNEIKVYDRPDFPLPMVGRIVFLPGGSRILAEDSGSPQGRIWDVNSSRQVEESNRMYDSKSFISYSYSPDGSLLAVGTTYGELLLLEAQSMELLGSYPAHSGAVRDVIFSPDGTRIISASFAGEVFRWAVN
jgi:serine/threonine protein kinase